MSKQYHTWNSVVPSNDGWDDTVVLRKDTEKKGPPNLPPKKFRDLVSDEPSGIKSTPITPEFRQRVVQARAALGFDQVRLALELSVKPSVIRDLENGIAVPPAQVMNKLCNLLKIAGPKK